MPRRSHLSEFSRAVGAIYDAGLDRSKWPEALGMVSGICGGIAAQMHVRGPSEQSVFGCVSGLPPEAHSEYIEHYAEHDVRFARLRYLPKSTVYREGDLISRDEIATSPIYNELLPRYDLGTVMVADLPVRELVAFFSVLGHKKLKGFESQNVEQLRMMLPHLARAVEIQARFHHVERELHASRDALESVAMGIVLIDGHAKVRFANRKALRIASDAGVRISRSGVDAAGSSSRQDLQSLISSALRTASGDGRTAGGAVRVHSARGVVLQVVPLPRSSDADRAGAWSGIEAMIILGRADTAEAYPTEPLRQLYGLTPAEADLGARLLGGHTVQQIAADRGVSVHTVRVQLKTVLSKAEVSRQAQFVAKTLRSLAGFGAP